MALEFMKRSLNIVQHEMKEGSKQKIHDLTIDIADQHMMMRDNDKAFEILAKQYNEV